MCVCVRLLFHALSLLCKCAATGFSVMVHCSVHKLGIGNTRAEDTALCKRNIYFMNAELKMTRHVWTEWNWIISLDLVMLFSTDNVIRLIGLQLQCHVSDSRFHVPIPAAHSDPNGLSPRQIKSDSDDDDLPNVTLDSVNETGSTALSIARAVQEWVSLPFWTSEYYG